MVQPAGASEEESREGWRHRVGFLEEAADKIWMEMGPGEADGRNGLRLGGRDTSGIGVTPIGWASGGRKQ